jgi:hypothetical protein
MKLKKTKKSLPSVTLIAVHVINFSCTAAYLVGKCYTMWIDVSRGKKKVTILF